MSSPVTVTSLLGRPVFVELIRIRGVVKADVVSESDPYVKMSIRKKAKSGGGCCSSDVTEVAGKLIANSIEYKWPTVDDEPNPGYFTTVWLAKEAKAGSVLNVQLFDEDATSDELLGEINIDVEKLTIGKKITLPVPYVDDASRIQEIEVLFRENYPNTKKRVVIIRHGESLWNEAQSEMNLSTMASRTDHPLTPLGCAQALGLAKKVHDAIEEAKKQQQQEGGGENQNQSKEAAVVADLLGTDVIYVSPLCRAIQTAILGLHPLGPKPSWEMKKSAREKRNFGGKDSSGTTFGKDFIPFLMKELEDLVSNYAKAEAENSLPDSSSLAPFPPKASLGEIISKMDATETETKWWTDDREGTDDSSRRISDLFFQQVMWDPRPVVVIVGHSHFFRDMFVHYMSEGLRTKISNKDAGYDEFTLEQWFNYKLENCGAAHVEFDFSKIISSWQEGKEATGDALKCIEDVSLVFGTKLIP